MRSGVVVAGRASREHTHPRILPRAGRPLVADHKGSSLLILEGSAFDLHLMAGLHAYILEV